MKQQVELKWTQREMNKSFREFSHVDFLGHPINQYDRLICLKYNGTSAEFLKRRAVRLTESFIWDNAGNKWLPSKVVNIDYYEKKGVRR